MKDKHADDLVAGILIRILEHTCQISILLPLQSFGTRVIPGSTAFSVEFQKKEAIQDGNLMKI